MSGGIGSTGAAPATSRTAILAAAAAAVVLYGTLRGLMVARFPAFVDESLYAEWSRLVARNHDWFASLPNGKEPLLTWLAAGFIWLGVFPLTAVKLVSLLAGVVTVIATALVAAELGWIAAVTAALLTALVPFYVVHDAIGIMEPLLGATLTLALLLEIRLARRASLRLGLLLGLAFGAALLTKRTGWFAVAMLPASLLVFPWRAPDPRGRLLRWLGAAAVAAGLGTLIFSILRLSSDYDTYVQRRDHLGSYHSLGTGLAHWTHWFSLNAGPYLSALRGYVTLPILLAALAGFVLGLRDRPGLVVFLALWVVGPYTLAVLVAENPYPRYIYEAVPPLLVLAGYSVQRLYLALARVPRRPAIAAVVVAGVALVANALVRDAVILADPARAQYPARDDKQYATDWPAGNAWVAAAHELLRRGAAADGVPCYGDCSLTVEWELQSHGFHLEGADSPEADTAPYVLVSGTYGAPPPRGVADLRQVWRYDRPRSGTPLLLYQRGVRVRRGFATSPDRLRTLLGLPDRRFDRWIATHPRARAWYEAWYKGASTGN